MNPSSVLPTIISGLCVAFIGFFLNDQLSRRISRKRILIALLKQIEVSQNELNRVATKMRDTVRHAASVVQTAKSGTLDTKALNELFCGCALHAPSCPPLQVISTLRESEIRSVVEYFTLWQQLNAYDSVYSAAHSKLVELSSHPKDIAGAPRILELAVQLKEALEHVLRVADALTGSSKALNALSATQIVAH